MTGHTAYGLLKRTLENERDMRRRVFRQQPDKQTAKVAEINNALAALEQLAQAAGIQARPEPLAYVQERRP